MKIFFSVGEPSGDLHGANLIDQLRRRDRAVECVGYGGPRMAAAGCTLHEDLTKLAVMWLFRVLVNLHKFFELLGRADRYFRRHRPDAVVIIDYPGFNWWIARRAKAHGIPVFYYGTPQMWAWAGWRVRKMRRLVDHVLCKLPFEVPWYRERGVSAIYVGHPYFDQLAGQSLDRRFIDSYRIGGRPLVTILPGSRMQEVHHNLRWFFKAAAIIHRRLPDVRFAVASFNDRQAEVARALAVQRDLPVDVLVGRTQELIHLADCCMACSGSVSLELLYHTTPTVILYQISRLGYHLLPLFVKVKYVTLVNLLASDEVFPTGPCPPNHENTGRWMVPFPEYVTYEDKSEQIAAHLIEWLTNDPSRQERTEQLAELKSRVCQPGASSKAADYIVGHIRPRPVPIPRPHFIPGAAVVTDRAKEAIQE